MWHSERRRARRGRAALSPFFTKEVKRVTVHRTWHENEGDAPNHYSRDRWVQKPKCGLDSKEGITCERVRRLVRV